MLRKAAVLVEQTAGPDLQLVGEVMQWYNRADGLFLQIFIPNTRLDSTPVYGKPIEARAESIRYLIEGDKQIGSGDAGHSE